MEKRYIPNLGFGKGKAKKQTSDMKLQDEHNCLSLITNQIIKIHNGGGFWTEVMGRRVCVKLWIHLIAGDTSGHNNIVSPRGATITYHNSSAPYGEFFWSDMS